ncbi:hypothetical protein CBR_g4524 [Chara braunii]|uniref:Uncharacterized protein n=1 Tax=Chara braunii TaxID=69332 RepID=A0A388KI03_CHABU|nr:hypothetical protein CBR_g4524 [Chara braunii]|eukprot:GBG69694.1 hypothetical protein CBR_g4524 [Chara braunii]
MQPQTFTPAMRGELGASPAVAEVDEDLTTPGETSVERLDRFDSHRACLLARADPMTQELARLAAKERQRQLGTFMEIPPDAQAAAHIDLMTEVRDGTQVEVAGREAAFAGTQGEAAAGEAISAGIQGEAGAGEATSPGMSGEATGHEAGGSGTGGGEAAGMQREAQGLQETEVPTPDDPRLVPDLPLHDGQRTEDAFRETEDMPPGLEDIRADQSMGVDDGTPSAQPDRIAPTTGGGGGVTGDAIVEGGKDLEERVQGDPVSSVGVGRHVEVDTMLYIERRR